jgi:hypothetical protein
VAGTCEYGNEHYDRCTESNYIVSEFILLDKSVEKCLELREERGAVLGAVCSWLYVDSKWSDFETGK